MNKLRILLADASVTDRKLTADAVEGTSLGEVVHTAPNMSIALEWLEQCPMDVVLLGADLVRLNDSNILDVIKAIQPDIEIIILSSGDPDSAVVTLKALEQGAFDFILRNEEADPQKTVSNLRSQFDILFAQIKVKKYTLPDAKKEPGVSEEKMQIKVMATDNLMKQRKKFFEKPELVLIASSTGGPAALETVLKLLPDNFPVPILAVQHMPVEFTAVFAQNLDKVSQLNVIEAKNGCEVKNGQAIIAAGGFHMIVKRLGSKQVVVALDKSPYVNGVRPSADVLFNSAANAFEGRNILAVILTGMGNDGMQGVSILKSKCNCYCITQSEKTCVVYGMPRCVLEAGLSDEAADIRNIAERICRLAL